MSHVIQINSTKKLKGILTPPADKSISHRSIILGSLAEGTSKITNFLESADALATLKIMQQLGASIQKHRHQIIIHSPGFQALKATTSDLNAENSGTTMRLLAGVLSNIAGKHTLIGDDSLSKRPMKRIIEPLSLMGAQIKATNNHAPLYIEGRQLSSCSYTLPVASAQVKSAIILAALFAQGTTEIIEPIQSRDHTEKMLPLFGGQIIKQQQKIIVPGQQNLTAANITVPGDFSSAAFFIVAGLITPNSQITLNNVNLNPTRTGLLSVLDKMHANYQIEQTGAELGNITVSTSNLKATEIKGDLIPLLIDELPIVALLATQAEGTTIISDAEELRYKESDRIAKVALELSKLGANIEEKADGLIIHGRSKLIGASVASHYDHRLGMMLGIAAQIAEGTTIIKNYQSVNISYPHFWDDLRALRGE